MAQYRGAFLGGLAQGIRAEKQLGIQQGQLDLNKQRLGLDQRRVDLEEKQANRKGITDLQNGIKAALLALSDPTKDPEAIKKILAISIATLTSGAYDQEGIAAGLKAQKEADVLFQNVEQRRQKLAEEQGRLAGAKAGAEAKATVGIPGTEANRRVQDIFIRQQQLKLDAELKQAQIALAKAKTAAIGKPDQKTIFNQEKGLRDSYIRSSKDYASSIEAIRKVEAASKLQTGIGDISILYGYMKLIDPGSRVTEQDYATAENATNVPARIRNFFNKALDGQRLTPQQRKEFVEAANAQFKSMERVHAKRVQETTRLAKEYGLKPSRVIITFNERGIPSPVTARGEVTATATKPGTGERAYLVGDKWYGADGEEIKLGPRAK